MDTALPQKFPFILDRNLAKANCTRNQVFTSYDTVVLGTGAKKNSILRLGNSKKLFSFEIIVLSPENIISYGLINLSKCF